MEEDDLMFNFTRASTTTPKSAAKDTQHNNKKDKYTMKFKKEKAKNRRAGNAEFTYNLLPTPGQSEEKPKEKQVITQKNDDKPAEQQKDDKQNFKRTRNYQREDRSNDKMRGDKRVKRDYNNHSNNNNNFDRSVKGEISDPSKVKIVTPDEIQLEQVRKQDNIDTNSFEQYNLNPHLLSSLVKNGINKFTDIQNKCYHSIFSGKDCIAKASTGSGKTLAYLIPLVNQYLQRKTITKREDGTTMLIICPSRELCVQGQKQSLRCLKRCPFIVPGSLIGGQQTNHQKMRLRKGINVLFSTPGRLIYHLKNTQSFKITNIKTIVFEQADRTLDMGFQKDVIEILDIFSKKLDITYIQKILVSAHFNEKVQNLLTHISMDNPKYIGFEGEQKEDEVKFDQEGIKIENEQGENHANLNVQQINISKNLRQKYVLMTEQERIPMMIAYLRLTKDQKVMIFVNTIDEVEYLDYLLNNMVYRDSNGNFTEQKIENRKVFKIHGNLDQKYRTNTYFQFKKEKQAILISTEVASRGLDFPDLNHIILFDVPPTLTDYGNRVGRSARFNSSGVSLLMLHYQQSDYAQQIRYYSPTLEMLDKQVIFQGFEQYLHRLNIHEKGLYYIEGIVRSLVKDDDQKYQLARRAYVSMLRAYAKLKDKHIFAVKRLDLKLLGRCFGINSTGGKMKTYNPKAKESHLQSIRKTRRVENIKKLQVSEYL